jgi:DNA-binding beta-propeller fold protein YncE
MGLDNQNHRIFSGCNNQLMTVLDIETGKLLGTVPIGKGVDGNGFDPETKTAFSSNGGDGTLTVVQETAPGKYAAVATVKTQPGSRTMTIDPKTHNVYLPCVDYPPAAEAKPGEAKSRPAAIKDSFAILVVGK